ncbi:GNAT family N-acetyltransferase [Haloferax mediterranei ATCC 33500]|uniref:GCN5 family acetyltransferase n=1 Tax=Haloferax mediterranei (strain ATCC 33500 / DSM 1411 / JCM 8866 / NBRC 14739 / NCIMB 2177 / R-4) TaxID=523841 RepID=I3R5M8_HALMT|nr:GNAT family N-acetyltransferase [Haloferax mediterranei]AFK19538.1 GCN5-related N-acetyltransferase [Haloferax mediterranei ATCC 33500]AHZ22933.1 GCN5 family acetyltransferase [Haloferax mediterranei ATCC 33500]ELZ99858.1 N-acetyltransferase GCN5 [Haloferax mediterranei ATCC 33500]MDX5987720.1 GNAT family N-acetyltransferase [Haloferax mediterranei ATCC 33500]QCQ74202.1 GNAT family N-acetyltransferase [Haloferax mediterranei ATCC 33500]
MASTTGEGSEPAFWDPSHCTGTPYCPPRCPRFIDAQGTGLVIRPYEPTDWEALNEMYCDYAREHRSMGLPPVDDARVAEWLEGLTERGRNLVAIGDESVVGHVTYVPQDDPEPEIAVFVHQESHNRGIGTELCRHIVAEAVVEGLEALVLHVAPENRRAIHVYLGLGFEVVPSESTDTKMRLSVEHANVVTNPTAADVGVGGD